MSFSTPYYNQYNPYVVPVTPTVTPIAPVSPVIPFQPTVQPVVQPVIQPVVQPIPQPVIQPVVQPVIQPIIPPEPEPVIVEQTLPAITIQQTLPPVTVEQVEYPYYEEPVPMLPPYPSSCNDPVYPLFYNRLPLVNNQSSAFDMTRYNMLTTGAYGPYDISNLNPNIWPGQTTPLNAPPAWKQRDVSRVRGGSRSDGWHPNLLIRPGGDTGTVRANRSLPVRISRRYS